MYVTSVAATGVNFAKRMSDPLRRPTRKRTGEHHDEPEQPESGRATVEDEERPYDDEEPGEWADREIDAAEQQRECLSEGDEAERRARERDGGDVEVRDVPVVLRPDVDSEGDHHDREDDDRRVVAFDEPRDPRRAARSPPRLLCGVRRRADRSVDDALLGHFVALERRDGVAARHHDHSVAETLELERVARGDDDRHSASGDLAQDAVDLRTRADVDALCRLVRDENRRIGEHRAGHHDLLLVPARERRNGRLERRSLDGQRRKLTDDGVDARDDGSRTVPS